MQYTLIYHYLFKYAHHIYVYPRNTQPIPNIIDHYDHFANELTCYTRLFGVTSTTLEGSIRVELFAGSKMYVQSHLRPRAEVVAEASLMGVFETLYNLQCVPTQVQPSS